MKKLVVPGELISQERAEQIEMHGKNIDYDIMINIHNQLPDAAFGLIKPKYAKEECPFGWNQEIWKHMLSKSYVERLIIAGALIAAEIDRLNYEK